MKINRSSNGFFRAPSRTLPFAAACLCFAFAHTMPAQDTKQAPHVDPGTEHVLSVHNTASQQDQTEILTAMRNILSPSVRMFFVYGRNAIAFRGSDEEYSEAQKLLAELDVPYKRYRLTYTLNDSDGGKRIGSQHFSVVIASGQRNQLKQGSRVPVTVTYSPTTQSGQNQVTYIDIGINFDATIDELKDGVRLRSKIERSSVAEEKADSGGNDPIIRQSTIEGTSILTLNKPILLGSMDVPGSTRHVDIEVTAELAK